MTVTTGGRGRRWLGSASSSSRISPSRDRTSRSKWNLSPTSRAAVGSSTSFRVAMTPSSRRALITSPDLRRIAAASSPTVTDSGTLISSRLISWGGSGSAGGAGRGCGFPGVATTAAAAGRAGGAATAGRGGGDVAAGRAGAAGAGGSTILLGAGGASLTSAGGGATAAGLMGITGVGADIGLGLGGAIGGAGAAGGGAVTTAGAAGGATGTAEGGTSTGGAGAAEGRKIVAVGLMASTASSGSSSTLPTLAGRCARFVAPSFELSAFPGDATTSAASSADTVSLSFGARLGLLSTGRSRPRPSLTRSSVAVSAGSGLMARMPLWPMLSSATTRSLLVTPNSFARSITFIRPATMLLPPPPGFQDLSRAFARRPDRPFQRARKTSREGFVETVGRRASIRAPSRRHPVTIHDRPPVVPPHQPHQFSLRLDLAAADAGPLGTFLHSADARGTGSSTAPSPPGDSPSG